MIEIKDTVRDMCQIDSHVWVGLKCGTLLLVDGSTFKTKHQINKPELSKDDLVQMITVDDNTNLIALAYRSGSIVFISSRSRLNSHYIADEMHSLAFGILEEVDFKQENIKLFAAHVLSSQIYAVEASKPAESGLAELWCGCEKGVIEIFIPYSNNSLVQLKTTITTYESSGDIPQDSSIIQLKSSFNSTTQVYALHDRSSIISCWSVCKQPMLNSVIKLPQSSSPGNN